MKTLTNHILEKLIINKDFKKFKYDFENLNFVYVLSFWICGGHEFSFHTRDIITIKKLNYNNYICEYDYNDFIKKISRKYEFIEEYNILYYAAYDKIEVFVHPNDIEKLTSMLNFLNKDEINDEIKLTSILQIGLDIQNTDFIETDKLSKYFKMSFYGYEAIKDDIRKRIEKLKTL